MKFEAYFSFKAILRDLIRWRVKGRDVGDVLPPRKMWIRAGAKKRKGVSPEGVRRQAIWRTVRRVCGEAGTSRPEGVRWVENLMKLVEEVRASVFSGTVAFEPPKRFRIPKGLENGVMQFREVASFERLADRVVLSRMMAYVRDRLESELTENCYSFRKDSSISHQLAIERLQDFRAIFPVGTLFVAECDIKKFFDNIPHETVRRRWQEAGFDVDAGKVLEAYLAVYAAEAEGQSCTSAVDERRGLPQGGAFSTVLANLVLAEADDAVAKVDDGHLFYARYCDDVVFVHPDAAVCRRAMEAYAAALEKLGLPMHPLRSFVYKPADGSPTEYFSLKSKGPFRWREAGKGEAECAPWVSFLGSQVRYDGETRIRKESIEKHIRSLGQETAKAVRELENGMMAEDAHKTSADAAEWFSRFRNRLIAKGVGYVTEKVKNCDMCWAGAFPNVTACADTIMQMRRLDRVREGMLAKVWRRLADVAKGASLRPHRYKGRPFSYFGFLKEARRPTNMAYRRRVWWIRALPYSEL
ncbi:MAG: hypothetical protein J5985_08175 [Kiritimatiellae bacterium]|nr:hypothetical protein [Kiritimatiellia bacterium]